MAVIIFKPTEQCNSNCLYCDVVKRADYSTIMSLKLLELVFVKINDYLLKDTSSRITFIWHGGEPLLLGVDYFEKALAFCQAHCPTTLNRIDHAIQSNLMLLTPEFLTVFRKLGISSISTSYECIPHIRGPKPANSSIVDSTTYNQRFFKGLNLLKKENFGWGLIYVVTKKSLDRPLDIFRFLSNLKMSHSGFLINPVQVFGEDSHNIAITPMEYADFLGAIFPYWWENRRRFRRAQPFKSIADCIVDKNLALSCHDTGECYKHYWYIGPSGNISHCGRAADWDLVDYGNIADSSLEESLHNPKRNDFAERNNILQNGECSGCRFWDICHGGCPLDALYSHKSVFHKSEWGCSRKLFIEKYVEPITGFRFEACNG
jgi:uncharacterized protein